MTDFDYSLPLLPDDYQHDLSVPAAYKIFGNSDYGSNNDIITSIIDLMPYRDLRNFALSCRLFLELSQTTLWRRYCGKKFLYMSAQSIPRVHELLTLATKHPKILQGVQNVSICVNLHSTSFMHCRTKKDQKRLRSLSQIYQLGWSMVESCRFDSLKPEDYFTFMESRGMHWATVLLLVCPNIQWLGIDASLAKYCARIVVAAADVSQPDSLSYVPMPLFNLAALTIQGTKQSDTGWQVSLDTILRIASAPKLQTLKCYSLSIDRNDPIHTEKHLGPTPELKVTYAYIVDCIVAPSAIARIIEYAPELQYLEVGGNAHLWTHQPLHPHIFSSDAEGIYNEQGNQIGSTPLGQYGKTLKFELGSILSERGLNISYYGTGVDWDWSARVLVKSRQITDGQ